MNKNKDSFLDVKIIALGEIIWKGKAKSVSAENTTGVFDILPQHVNFISILKETPIVIQTEKEKKEFSLSRSLIYAKENIVKIYTGI